MTASAWGYKLRLAVSWQSTVPGSILEQGDRATGLWKGHVHSKMRRGLEAGLVEVEAGPGE